MEIGFRSCVFREPDRTWEVNERGRIVTLVEMAVDGTLGTGDVRGVCHDMADMLSFFQGGGNNAVCLIELLPVKGSPFSGIREEPPVLGVCRGGAVKETDVAAGVAFRAAVTDEGRLQEQGAGVIRGSEGITVFLPVVFDLVRDGGGVLLDNAGGSLERQLFSEALLNLFTVLHGKVFVFPSVRIFSHLCGLLSWDIFPRLNSTTDDVSK